MKPGKKEKIRFGHAPTKTLPSAGRPRPRMRAGAQQTASSGQEPVNPLENNARPTQKTRFSERAKQAKQAKPKDKGPKTDALAPEAPDAAEVADRQTQAGPLGLAGDTSAKKKKKPPPPPAKRPAWTRKRSQDARQPSGDLPLGPAPQIPAPAPAPQPQQ